MTFIGNHLPDLVPFMEDTYTPQAVNQARNSFKKKVRKSSATFFYGAMCGFFTTDELDDVLFEASEVARFLLEIEGTTLDIDEEIDIEDRITQVMRSVGEAAKTILRTRAEETGSGNIPHNRGSEAPKKMSGPMETDISSPKKIKRRKKNADRVSAKNPLFGFEHQGTVEIIPMITETAAIEEVVSIVNAPSDTSPAIIQIQEIISHIPTTLIVPRKNEKNEQYISKDEPEIEGDKTS
jgi:hypothetical protein